MTRRRKKADSPMKRKWWTIICLVAVCAAAIFLRASVVYRVYPLAYETEIATWSAEYAIDEYLVCAVIRAESSFDAEAVSPVGAVGLMQVMPSTGQWAAEKIGIPDYTEDMLSDPATNIRIGCWYLGYLGGLFDADARKVLAAYNAGPANVREWLETDSALQDIPFEETEKYLERVQINYEIYKGLYDTF